MGWVHQLVLALLVSSLLVDAAPTGIQKVRKIVVLMQENRSWDHMFGWWGRGNGLKGNEYNLVNTSNPSSPKIMVDKLEPMIAPCDPDHSTIATTVKIFGMDALQRNDTKNATMTGFVEWENMRGMASTNYCDVMSMLTPDHVPIMTALASEFALMDRFFAAHPGPTWPNRMFMLSGTSAGLTETGPWYHDKPGQLFPQQTIFDQLTKEGFTWRNYYNDTPWELFIQTIAHNPQNLMPLEQFYADCAKGELPDFSWINPRAAINVTTFEGSNDHHPDHDISLGERYYKDIYQAIRASPHWNETLFIVTYDEHGGYYDHVPTPLGVPPPGDGETSYPDNDILFDRLGVRLPTLLISPWIPKGQIISGPPAAQKPQANSEYSLTSIIATTRILLGMKSPPLTKRDAWSATFEQVLSLNQPRTDCPMHLPESAPPSPNFSPKEEYLMPINGLQEHITTVHAGILGMEFPASEVQLQGHMSTWAQTHFHKHKELTHAWKESKTSSQYTVQMQTDVDVPGGVVLIGSWSVLKGTTVDFYTIALRNTLLCLDYGSAATKGVVLGVSNCYPSADPNTNRDPGQQWIWDKDSTIKPAADKSLCLTNALYNNNTPLDLKLYLQPCDKSVQQHWSYDGPAPGSYNSGSIFFGNFGSMVVANTTTPAL